MDKIEEIKNKLFGLRAKLDVLFANEVFAMHCCIQRALSSGKMHNWFACKNCYLGIDAAREWDKVRIDEEYMTRVREANTIYANCTELAQKLDRSLLQRDIDMDDGKPISKIRLAIAGFPKDILDQGI